MIVVCKCHRCGKVWTEELTRLGVVEERRIRMGHMRLTAEGGLSCLGLVQITPQAFTPATQEAPKKAPEQVMHTFPKGK